MTGIDKGQLLRIEAATIVARALAGTTFAGPLPLARFIADAAEALEPYLRGPGYTVNPGGPVIDLDREGGRLRYTVIAGAVVPACPVHGDNRRFGRCIC